MTNSRRKGINGELEACKLFRPYFPDVRRSFGQSRKGYEQPDLIGGGIEKEFYIEVKRTKKEPSSGQIDKWLAKLTDDCEQFDGGILLNMVLVYRRNHNINWKVFYQSKEDIAYRKLSWSQFSAILIAKYGGER